MKFKSIIIGLLLLCTFSFVACTRDEGMDDNSGSVNDNNTNTNYDNNANNDNTSNNDTNTDTNTNTNGDENNDAVTSASRANSVESFKNAVENSWIVIVEKDLEIPEDVTLKAGFKKTSSEESGKLVNTPRVLAMYSSDESGNIKDSYTLTVPKLTILDDGAKLEGGTLKGDVYVDADNVVFEKITVDGNIYFKDENAKSSCVIDEHSKVNGNMEIK